MRGGINLAVVRSAYDELVRSGVHPSAQAIRQVLGSGSLTTIHNHLKTIAAEEGGPLDVLKRMDQTLAETVLSLGHRLRALSKAEIATAKVQFDLQVAELTAERNGLADTLATVEQALAKAEQELARALAQNEQLHQDNDEYRLAGVSLRQQLASADERNGELRTQVERAQHDAVHARQQRDHYEELTRAQMAQMQNRHEKDMENKQIEVGALTTRLVEATNDLAEHKMRLSTSEATALSVKAQLAEVRGELAEARAANSVLAGQAADKDKRNTELVSSLESAHEREREAGRALAATTESLAEIRQAMAVATNNLERRNEEIEALKNQLAGTKARLQALEEPSTA